jgi:hypothetical protein
MEPVGTEPSEVKPARKKKPRVGRRVQVAEGVDLHLSGNGRYQGEFRFITREQLDGRTRAAHFYDSVRDDVIRDLGGEDQLNAVQRQLVDAFVGASLVVNDMSTRCMLGESIDVEKLSNAMSTLLRLSRMLGVSMEIKKNEPGFSQYMQETYGAKQA